MVKTLKVQSYLNSIKGFYLEIFIDGSWDPESERAGFGVYEAQLDLKIGKRVTNRSSVFVTELLAILCALQWIGETRQNRVIICSDSAAVLMALEGSKSKVQPDIHEVFSVWYRIKRTGGEVMLWGVPGHAESREMK